VAIRRRVGFVVPYTWRHVLRTTALARLPDGVRSPTGRHFIRQLSDRDAAAVQAGMADVRDRGLRAARHLGGEIWEVRADGDRVIYRVLFAQEGSRGQVLLALEAFNKKTRQTPPATIALARQRLEDWRRRGASTRELRSISKKRYC